MPISGNIDKLNFSIVFGFTFGRREKMSLLPEAFYFRCACAILLKASGTFMFSLRDDRKIISLHLPEKHEKLMARSTSFKQFGIPSTCSS